MFGNVINFSSRIPTRVSQIETLLTNNNKSDKSLATGAIIINHQIEDERESDCEGKYRIH